MKKMLKARVFPMMVFLFATLISNAQGGWERNYTLTPSVFSNFYRVVLSSDGGYCALAPWDFDTTSIHLLKTDPDGVQQWEVSLPAGDTMNSTSLYAANDGGYLLSRGTQKGWGNSIPLPKASLLKFSSLGGLVWRKNYYLGQSASFKRVKELQNGQIMAVGEVYQNAAYHGLILRTDAAGGIIDTANISIPLGRVTLQDFYEKSDGTFLVLCEYISNSSQTFWIHLDNQLNVLETKILDNASYNTATRFSSNGTLFLARINLFPYQLSIDKVNTNGELLWEKNFTNQWGVNIGQSEITIDDSPDGGCVFAAGDNYWAIVKLDEDGNEEWFRNLNNAPNAPNTREISDIRSTPDNGCIACGYQYGQPNYTGYLIKIGENGTVYSNIISGRMVSDTEQNCTNDPTDRALSSRLVKATGINADFYVTTNTNGLYTMDVPPGSYVVHSTPSALGIPASYCVDSVTVNLPNIGDAALVDFTDTLPRCPLMNMSLGAQVIRPCFAGTYNGQLSNTGTDTAFNAYVIITLDSLLSYTSSTPLATSVVGQTIRLDFGDIPSGQNQYFKVNFFTDCNAPLGYTHCSEARAYPDSSCLPTNGLWGGASLAANAVCNGDSVLFKIQNIGTGTMTESAEFIVIEDDMIQRQTLTPILAPGGLLQFSLAADGSTYRIEVDQEPFHPSLANPSAVIQGCNAGVFTTGFVNLFSTPDDDPWIDIDCRMNTNSFDPNSKEATPVGYGAQHFIEANTALEYTLHFQNTGTAEAITVVLKDTIEATLDLLSLEPGASSHAYTWSVTGKGVLTFRFDNILLPDSNTNEPGSKGFVIFRIRQKPNLPLGTVINNSAAIYFDFNAPIITNTTEHIIGKDFVPMAPPVTTVTPSADYQWQVSPNPAQKQVVLSNKDIPASFFPLHITVTDMLGRKIHQGTMSGSHYSLKRGGLASGFYFYQIQTESGAVIGNGKICFDGL